MHAVLTTTLIVSQYTPGNVFGWAKYSRLCVHHEQDACQDLLSYIVVLVCVPDVTKPAHWMVLWSVLCDVATWQVQVFAKIPGPVRAWVDDMCDSWDFKRVISAHFCAPVEAGPEDVR